MSDPPRKDARVLASHARPRAVRSAATPARLARAPRLVERRRAATMGLAGRRVLLHVFCLGLIWLAASGPLAALSSVGSRGEVAAAVERHARYLAAAAEAEAPGGWNVPRFPLTIAEVTASNPVELVLPSAPSSLTQPGAGEAAPAAIPAAQASGSARPLVAPTNPAREAVRTALAQRFSTLSEAYGVVVLDADGTPLFQHGQAALFQAASLYKLGVAAEVFRQERSGVISFKDPMVITNDALIEGDTMFVAGDVGKRITIGEAVDFMITRSSNVAAILLLKRVGPYNVNTIFGELGLKDTRLLDRPFRNIYGNAKNQTTPRDIARFFDLLLHGKVVDNQTSQAIIKLLLRQKIDDRLPSALPESVLVAHKTGNLVGVVHDAGIIYTPAPIIVVALSQDVSSEAEAVATIAQVARVAYEAYTGATAPTEPPAAR